MKLKELYAVKMMHMCQYIYILCQLATGENNLELILGG